LERKNRGRREGDEKKKRPDNNIGLKFVCLLYFKKKKEKRKGKNGKKKKENKALKKKGTGERMLSKAEKETRNLVRSLT